MWSLLVLLGLGAIAPFGKDGLPVAPVDIEPGRQVVALRKPLHARSAGAYLILYVRDRRPFAGAGTDAREAFEASVPEGAVVARLRDGDGAALSLTHRGYSYYRGYAGIVLRPDDERRYGELYDELEVDSAVALPAVRFVWLSRGGERVEDIEPSL